MRDDKLSAAATRSGAGDAGRPGKFEQAGERQEATRRTVGVYERPARAGKLPLPLLVILILAALVSVVVTARFLF